ncbi:hypothetical protein BHM03_00003421 [Ensete ventricosum]|nr:hypothetical protein BHM03_00003421 [Ensete ventricosum]
MLKFIEESEEEVQEPKENTKEDPQPADRTTHVVAGHVNPQVTKVEESFMQQLVTVLTNILMNGKGEQVTSCEKHGSEVMMILTQRLQKLAEISGASTEPYKLFLKCHIQSNQLWLLKQRSQILGYFHDFFKEWTIMLKIFPDDDHRSTAHDYKKIESL